MNTTTKNNSILSSKFIKILKSFSSDELKAFELWLQSPWCNTNKTLIKLLGRIKKHHPQFDNNKLTKERLFQKILPNGKFSDRRMNNIFSEAYLAAEQFIVFQHLLNNQNLQADLRVKEFQNRNLEEWFFRDAQKEIDRMENIQIKSWENHLELFQMYQQTYLHPGKNPKIQSGGITVAKMGRALDMVYLLEKAAIINEKIFRNRILKNEDHDIQTELKKWYAACDGIEHLSIELYKIRFSYTDENMLQLYLQLRKVFIKKFDLLNPKEQKMHLFWLLNDTSYLARKKEIDNSERFPLYQKGLNSGVLFHNGKLTNITYYSIISASNTLKKFDFSFDFIEKYTSTLDEKHQLDGKFWGLAHTFYRKEELEKAIDLLIGHNFKIYFFQLASRLLTSQVYFDLFLQNEKYQFYLLNYFDSFEKWLSREKIHSKSNQKPYIRFVQICRKLAKAYSNVNFEMSMIENLLESRESIQAPIWLAQKIEDVIQLKRGRR